MGKVFLPLFILVMASTASAQYNLSGSRQSSVYTYIYQLSLKETTSLYRSSLNKLDEEHLHTLVDSFITAKEDTPALKPGNYLFVKAVQNKLEVALKTIGDLQIKHLTNNRDLLITVRNRQGQPVTDIQVYAGGRRMPWDEAMQLYRLGKKRSPKLITVLHKGVIHYYPLQRDRPYSLLRQIVWSFPLKYVSSPVQKLVRGQYWHRRYGNYYWSRTTHETKFTGFMALSKPMYKPGDTVKLKAFVMYKVSRIISRCTCGLPVAASKLIPY